ncbi:N utilization substance protein B [Capnocytophaga sp. HP1101]
MQSIYAMRQSQSQDLDKELKFLQNSADEMQHLYLLMLSLFIELHSLAIHQHEIAQKKYLATAQEKTLHQKLSDNLLLSAIARNTLLQETIAQAHINHWEIHEEYVRTIYKNIVESELYKKYSNQKNSFEADKSFLVAIFEEIIAPDETIYEYIEDYNLTWVDDYPIINTYISRLLKEVLPTSNNKYFVPSLYKDEEEKVFLTDLLKKAVLNDSKWENEIISRMTGWEKDRVAVIDGILLKMAVCEMLSFPSIPVKVTFNEYLELAKEYSTSKSSTFINGVMKIVHKELEEKQQIKKIGRGLL